MLPPLSVNSIQVASAERSWIFQIVAELLLKSSPTAGFDKAGGTFFGRCSSFPPALASVQSKKQTSQCEWKKIEEKAQLEREFL